MRVQVANRVQVGRYLAHLQRDALRVARIERLVTLRVIWSELVSVLVLIMWLVVRFFVIIVAELLLAVVVVRWRVLLIRARHVDIVLVVVQAISILIAVRSRTIWDD